MEQQTSNGSAWGQRALFFKMGFIVLLTLLLLLPLAWAQGLIGERMGLQFGVEQEVAASWGGQQTLSGPVLCIPYQRRVVFDGKPTIEDHTLYLAPEDLTIGADVRSEVRTKGIFNTIVFTTTDTLTGTFQVDALPEEPGVQYLYDEAVVITGLTDPTAIADKITSEWAGAEQKTSPGVKHKGFVDAGFHFPAPIDPAVKTYAFRQQFTARGSSSKRFLPSGRSTAIDLRSDWPSPSFTGRNLPQKRNISAAGFDARWNANEYNRPFGDRWRDQEFSADNDGQSFGVTLIETADFYQKNTRSAKYGILVIGLSFLVFFFYEMLLKIRIHPIQYTLVGMSLALFYTLLLALTEHLGFNPAYLTSSVAVISLVAVYVQAIIKNMRQTVVLTGLFAFLYGYIFVLLQLEDYALLVGAIGLFVILAIVMLVSRRIDWYKIGQN